MAETNANAFYPHSEERVYPFPKVAETDGQYKVEIRDDEWPREIHRIELRAQRTAASAQIGRLYQLANLILQPAPADRQAEDLERYGREIRRATGILEDTLHAMIDPIVAPNDPEHDED